MNHDIAVLTTVHHPDDVRIRSKLIPSLGGLGRVVYLAPSPGPLDRTGLECIELRGGRVARNLTAAREILRGRFDLLILHDPETLPLGLLFRLVRRRPVVFDLHEHLPKQILTKTRLPGWIRPLLSRAAGRALRFVEGRMTITLADESYRDLFVREWPVFPNYPRSDDLPSAGPAHDGSIVYVGDVTMQRGAEVVVEAVGRSGLDAPLIMVGRCAVVLGDELTRRASTLGVRLILTGHLPHSEAMAKLASARLAVVPLLDLPNYHDSLPTKLIEYLAVGVPVVASDLPGSRTAAGGLGGVRWAPPGNPAAWAEALRSAYEDEDSLLRARRQAFEVREALTWPEGAVRSFYEASLR